MVYRIIRSAVGVEVLDLSGELWASCETYTDAIAWIARVGGQVEVSAVVVDW